MRLSRVLFFFIALLSVQIAIAQVPVTRSEVIETQNGKNYYIHTVERGQTVYSIAKAYDVTVDEIYFVNPETKNGISVGQTILIPTINKETELNKEVKDAKFDFFYHVAASNETFQDISSVYMIPKKYIVKANPGLTEPLREGEYVKIPVEEAFDILDGKSNTKVAAPQTKTYQTSVPVTTTSSKKMPAPKTTVENKNKDTSGKQQQKTQANKPESEFVAFDPDIPIIQDYRHVVIMGETTKSIAEKYNIPVNLLKAANPGLGNSVTKGDRLRVPDKKKLGDIKKDETPVKDNKNSDVKTESDNNKQETEKQESANINKEFIKHTVKRKETLYSIGREYGVTVDEIKQANKGLTNLISIGQVILIPKKKITNPYIIHHVDKKTRVSKIARLYGIPTYKIADYNQSLGRKAYAGQNIKIPVGRKANIVPIEEIKEEVIIEETPEPTTKPVAEPAVCNPEPNFNKTFNVALMIPLSVEELDSLDREQFLRTQQSYFKPFRFIQFYEGLLVSLDSLEKQGMNVNLFVYDVDKNITKTAKILKQKELRSMDLIIGPFYSQSYNQVALFAGNFNIPIVNPLSYRESVAFDYSNSIKIKPGMESQLGMTQTFVNNFAPDSKIFLISQTSYEDADFITNLQNSLLSNMEPQVKFSNYDLYELGKHVAMRDTLYVTDSVPPPYTFEGNDIYPEILEANIADSTIVNNYFIRINYSADSIHPYLDNASVLRNNIVIVYGKKKSYILDVLNRLNETRDTFDIQLLGMPGWDRISNLSNEKMNNLNLSYFAADHIDYNSDLTQDFIYKFRNAYYTEPDIYAYLGYDIGYYFLSSLFYYGKDFEKCIVNKPQDLLLSSYKFRKVQGTNNYENTYWHLIKLRNMTKSKYPDYLTIPKKENDNE